MKDTCEILTGIFKEFNDKTCRPFNLKDFAERGKNMYTEKEILEFLNSFSGTNKDLKHLKDVKVMENHSTEEQLKEKISWLKSELNLKSRELSDKERYYTDKLKKLEQKVEKLKEDRKHLLQDKNAVINLTKGLLDDTIGRTTYEVNFLINKYFEALNNLNLRSNDSNTRTYLEVKQERDAYKRMLKGVTEYTDTDNVKLKGNMINTLNAELKKSKAKIEHITKTYLELEKSRDHFKRKLKEENDDLKEKIEYRNEIIKQLQKQNQGLVNEINILKEENGSLKEKIDILKVDNEYLIGKLRRARTELCFNKRGE